MAAAPATPLASMAASKAASDKPFVTSEAVHLHDAWSTSVYSGVCFEKRRRWVLPVQKRTSLHLPSFTSMGFQRFPLQAQAVPDRNAALAQRKAKCWRSGVTFVADLRHGGGPTMGIAHFAKRILRLHGLQRHAAEYNLPTVDRVTFPATSAVHLAHSWPASVLKLIAPHALVESAETLIAAECCYETLIAAGRENTYFVQPADADALRDAAHKLARVPATRPPCAPVQACYFQRSEGRP